MEKETLRLVVLPCYDLHRSSSTHCWFTPTPSKRVVLDTSSVDTELLTRGKKLPRTFAGIRKEEHSLIQKHSKQE